MREEARRTRRGFSGARKGTKLRKAKTAKGDVRRAPRESVYHRFLPPPEAHGKGSSTVTTQRALRRNVKGEVTKDSARHW